MVSVRRRLNGRLDLKDRLGLIFIKRCAAFSTKIVVGPELDEMTMVATYNFPGINRRQCCCHGCFGVARAGNLSKNHCVGLRTIAGSPLTWGSFKHQLTIVNKKVR
jgi:hypothetical protein